MRKPLQLLTLSAVIAVATGCSIQPHRGGGHGGHGGAEHPKAPRAVQRCDSAGAQWAVGKTNTEHNVAEARKRSGAYMARVLRPGQPTTRELNPERLNLEVDATGRILSARCG